MNRLENMETFVRVVEAGSISAAAERLGVAKSAVSRRLKELETHLGVELFHRTTRRMNRPIPAAAFTSSACVCSMMCSKPNWPPHRRMPPWPDG